MSWPESASNYASLIEDQSKDSRYLREHGLKPNLLDLIGPCDQARLLDAGTGTAWLFQHIRPAAAFACDIVRPSALPAWVEFTLGNLEDLPYENGLFDIVTCSLVLMFCPRLDAVCTELNRVTKPKGRLIISLTHPYFYRTGRVIDSGEFVVETDLSADTEVEIQIAGEVGPITYYYRQYPNYLNALVRAGWTIRATRDWFVDSQEHARLVSVGMRSGIPRSGKIPLYSFVECVNNG